MMKIAKDKILVALLGYGGFALLVIYIVSSQKRDFQYLKLHGWYTVAIGDKISKDRTGWSFVYKYKVNDEFYTGTMAIGSKNPLFQVGKVYFVVFDPLKKKKSMLIRNPAFPVDFNLDSIPKEGWKELPVAVEKDSITNFLDIGYF